VSGFTGTIEQRQVMVEVVSCEPFVGGFAADAEVFGDERERAIAAEGL
jgi:hypothetical protein